MEYCKNLRVKRCVRLGHRLPMKLTIVHKTKMLSLPHTQASDRLRYMQLTSRNLYVTQHERCGDDFFQNGCAATKRCSLGSFVCAPMWSLSLSDVRRQPIGKSRVAACERDGRRASVATIQAVGFLADASDHTTHDGRLTLMSMWPEWGWNGGILRLKAAFDALNTIICGSFLFDYINAFGLVLGKIRFFCNIWNGATHTNRNWCGCGCARCTNAVDVNKVVLHGVNVSMIVAEYKQRRQTLARKYSHTP